MHDQLPIPEGDILIHAGDMTQTGALEDVSNFNQFLGTLPHRHKVVIAGNHDFCFESEPDLAMSLLTNCIYLQDQAITLDGIKFYGSPWQPWFFDWAFNLERGPDIKAKWDLIPIDTNVLITHGPPFGHGDLTFRDERAGCLDLLEAVERLKPRLHIFGHIHEGAGMTTNSDTTFLNASSFDLGYNIVHSPLIFDYEVVSDIKSPLDRTVII